MFSYRSLWYQLDVDDGDVAGFFHFLTVALRGFLPRAKLPAFSNDWLSSPVGFARTFFRKLFSYPGAPELMVFDDYHTLPHASFTHAALAEALTACPSGKRIFIMSRDEPPAELSRLRIHGNLHLLPPDELLLSLEEGASIAQLREKHLTPSQVQSLHDLSRGWAAGFVFLLETEQTDYSYGPNKHQVFKYYDNEVLARFDSDTRTVLLVTSLLPDFTASVAISLTGVQRAGEILDSLADKGYFVYRLRSKEQAFRYHPLFREFLLTRAKAGLGADLSPILTRAASLLRLSGDSEIAAELACDAGDWKLVTDILEDMAPSLLHQGRLVFVRNLIKRFPSEKVAQNPWLQYWLGVSLFQVQPAEAFKTLESAYHAFERAIDVTGCALVSSAIMDLLFFALDDLTHVPMWIARLDSLKESYDRLDKRTQSTLASAAVGAMINGQPDHPALPEWAERTFEFALSESEDIDRFSAVRAAVLYYGYCAYDLRRARILLDGLSTVFRTADPMNAILILVGESAYHSHSANAEKSLAAAAEGLAISEESGYHHWDPFLIGITSWVELFRGDLVAAKEALTRLAEMDSEPSPSLFTRILYRFTAGLLALYEGDVQRARNESESALRLVQKTHLPLLRTAVEINLALASVPDVYESKMTQALQTCCRTTHRGGEMSCRLALASRDIDTGDRTIARNIVAHAFSLARQLDIYNTPWMCLFDMSDLCALALEMNIETEYVTDLIRKRRIPASARYSGSDTWPWPLSVHCLSELCIKRDQRVIPSGRKSQKKPLELLRALVDAGPRGRTPDYLADRLWPDSDGDRAHHALHSTMNRLRKYLGISEAVLFKEGRFSLNSQIVYVDVWASKQPLGQKNGPNP